MGPGSELSQLTGACYWGVLLWLNLVTFDLASGEMGSDFTSRANLSDPPHACLLWGGPQPPC